MRTPIIFQANELTHPNRAKDDGRVVAEIVDHGPVSAAVIALTPNNPNAVDHVRYGVRFEGCGWNDSNGSQWATPREIGRTSAAWLSLTPARLSA